MGTRRANSTHDTKLKRFRKDQRGLSTIEYTIILVLIAVTSVAVWKNFGETLFGKLKMSNTKLENL